MVFTIQISEDGKAVEQIWVNGEIWDQPLVLVAASGWAAVQPTNAVQAMQLHSQLAEASKYCVEVAVGTAATAGYQEGSKRRKRGKRDKRAGNQSADQAESQG